MQSDDPLGCMQGLLVVFRNEMRGCNGGVAPIVRWVAGVEP
jgi:hypothetical protein